MRGTDSTGAGIYAAMLGQPTGPDSSACATVGWAFFFVNRIKSSLCLPLAGPHRPFSTSKARRVRDRMRKKRRTPQRKSRWYFIAAVSSSLPESTLCWAVSALA